MCLEILFLGCMQLVSSVVSMRITITAAVMSLKLYRQDDLPPGQQVHWAYGLNKLYVNKPEGLISCLWEAALQVLLINQFGV